MGGGVVWVASTPGWRFPICAPKHQQQQHSIPEAPWQRNHHLPTLTDFKEGAEDISATNEIDHFFANHGTLRPEVRHTYYRHGTPFT